MSFWNTSDEKPIQGSSSFEIGGGNPLPDGTSVLAAPVEAGWRFYEGEDYISISWSVLAPEQYKNRRVFQKLKVNDPDKADKAKRMLAAIDANAGGKLMGRGEAPDDQSLTQCLVGKPMMLRLGLWEINGKSGNWVQAVAPKAGAQQSPHQAPGAQQAPQQAPVEDEDVPF